MALESSPSMRVADLAKKVNVSTETIRRDLAELDRNGSINRTYGGAVRVQNQEPALAIRLKRHIKERQAIAKKAVSLVENSGSIFIGGGATMLHFAKALSLCKSRLVVITPAYSVAIELASNPLIQVLSLPGIYNGEEGIVHGLDTLRAIDAYNPQFAIIGTSGINSNGSDEALVPAAQVYTAMANNAESTLILADKSKFNKRELMNVTKWKEKIHLIVDDNLPEELYYAIKEAKGSIHVAS